MALLQYALDQSATPDAFAAAQWVNGLMVGPLGTSIAVIAVAWFGFAMLAGRSSLRRGAMLVLGCFVLFAAPRLAQALIGMAQAANTEAAPRSQLRSAAPPPPVVVVPPPLDQYPRAPATSPGK